MADDAAEKADMAAKKADGAVVQSNKIAVSTWHKVDEVISKLDDNTALTKAVSEAIVGHDAADLVGIQDENANATKHDLRGALNVVSLKLDRILDVLEREKP